MSKINDSIINTWLKQVLTLISSKLNTRIIYLTKFKRPINLKEPKTLDEKIQWLKFYTYYKNPLVTLM